MEIKYHSNRATGIVSIVLGIICWIIIPYQIGEDYSLTYGITSKTVPYAVAVLWIVCGIVLIVQSLVLKKDEIKTLKWEKELKALAYIGVLALYAFLFRINFLLSSIFLGTITLAFTGSRRKLYYLIVILSSGIIFLLFKYVLHIAMP